MCDKVFYKLNEFANIMGISYLTANRWFHSGKIPKASMIGRTIIIPKVLVDFIASGQIVISGNDVFPMTKKAQAFIGRE